jgi:hypothetical protein
MLCDRGFPPRHEDVVLGHLDDQATATADHEGRGMLGRDDVGEEGLPQDGLTVFQVRLPERVPLSHHRLLTGDAVDQDVQSTVLAIDPREEGLDLGFDGVIDSDCDGCAALLLDDRRGLVDRLGSLVRGEIAANTAPRAIHDRTGFAQGARDIASGAARGADDDDGDVPRQWSG